MMQPPLQLKKYFYPEFSVEAIQEFSPSKVQGEVALDLKVDIDLKKISEDARNYELHMGLQISPNEEANGPYRIKLLSVGIFEVHEDFPEDQIDNLLKINAVSMLYGMAREFVLTITSRGPFLPVMLPTTSFMSTEAKNKS